MWRRDLADTGDISHLPRANTIASMAPANGVMKQAQEAHLWPARLPLSAGIWKASGRTGRLPDDKTGAYGAACRDDPLGHGMPNGKTGGP